uniref:Large ribosomal subunit protein bL21c n=1 Tax=Aureoumbra lagunensis TaxID=44058 RepID=C6KIZ9_9STRA|nr:50S ribosomal protein L21 [Aureoumbra lagunensis]ACS36955.1 50S ribosomal protein L21 [Aureoumbra lagunensis]
MKYAVIEIGGKQIVVEEGKYYSVNRLPQKIGSSLSLSRILLCNDHGHRVLGYPYIENSEKVKVFATVLEHFNMPKITVFKMKPKKKLRWTRGHRQAQTRIMIDKIETKS